MKKLKNIFVLSFLIALIDISKTEANCTNIWDSDLNDSEKNLCPVKTLFGNYCEFPFTYNSIVYYTCIITGPNNPDFLPKCLLSNNQWETCAVPTDAIIDYVTTRKKGGSWINSVSLNGGTMIWINGKRFANNMFSIQPTSDTSNEVWLTSDYQSFSCEIHPDKVTSTQITCYAPAMPSDTYLVRVKVNGILIPMYQYINPLNAVIQTSNWNTPKITRVTPSSSIPGSLVTIEGDFKTECYTRDVEGCGDDSGSRITRIYFGGQICNLINSETNDLYENITSNMVKCKLEGTEINVFNTTILVSEEYGRSMISNNLYFITPDEKIYNYLTYPKINNISTQSGSVLGGTRLTIIGSYFYNDEYLNALIDISGSTCKVISYEQNDYINSKLICETLPKPNGSDSSRIFYGNRGMNVIRDSFYTQFNNLSIVQPSANSVSLELKEANFTDNQTTSTVWLRGFFAPQKSSNYEFSIFTNGQAQLYISESENINNRTLISYYFSSINYTTLRKYLEAYKFYYLEAIGSKESGYLNLGINGKMLNSVLVDKISANIKNEIQDIDLYSTIIPETINVNYSNLIVARGVEELQQIVIDTQAKFPFILSFDDVETCLIDFDSTATQIQTALNDLPTLFPNLVTVYLNESENDNNKKFAIKFSASLGDVPEIKLISIEANVSISELVKGSPSGDRVQLMIENKPTRLFDLRDSDLNIKNTIAESFGIRCPTSIISKSSDVIAVFDYENECSWSNKPINETSFCGKCARKNQNSFFYPDSFPLIYKYLCYAYKITKSFKKVNFYIKDINKQDFYPYVDVETIPDSQWHYQCVNIYDAFLKTSGFNLPISSLNVYNAYFTPESTSESYIDAVTLRKNLPLNYQDERLITTRRLYPSLQILQDTYTLTKSANNVLISYRPNNCSFNLSQISIRQKFPNPSNDIIVNKLKSASPPVGGTFDLKWNQEYLNNIPANITENSLKAYLETIKDFGTVSVTRSDDCYGYRYRIKWIEGGDKELFVINNKNLTGNEPNIRIVPIQDGSVSFSPLTDNILRTVHSKPQITVSINNIPSLCDGSCNFEWLENATPIVNIIDTSSKSLVKLTGTGFDSIPSNNLVLIGQTVCNVTSSTQTVIECIPGEGPVGVYNFTVYVENKGLARINDNKQFKYELTAIDFNPKISGTGGNLNLVIFGSGFSSEILVLIDNITCENILVKYTQLTCIIPSNPTNVDKEVEIVLIEGENSFKLEQKFFYDFNNSALVTNLSQTTFSVQGKELLTINGVNLPVNFSQILIGDKEVNLILNTKNQIKIETPQMEPGFYDLKIPTESLGLARINQKLEYVLYISSITPKLSSVRGGGLITILGDGFSQECALNKIFFERYECIPEECSKTKISCKTQSAQTVYEVSNTGLNPKFGFGYNWDKPNLIINVGDYVKWKWSPPNALNGLNFKIEGLKDFIENEPSGFSSGEPTPSGSFIYQFNKPGIYYYWSGYVEISRTISFRGVVIVNPSRDKSLSLDLTLNGYKAQKCIYNDQIKLTQEYRFCSNSSISRLNFKRQASENFTYENIDQNKCNSTSDDYSIAFTTCQIPIITSVNPIKITYNTTIEIQGSGFGSSICFQEVLIGGKYCSIKSSNDSNVLCKLGKNSGLEAGTKYNIELLVKNKGYAIHNDNFELNFIPVITSLSETQGSINGGSTLSLDGDGFTKNTVINIGQHTYTYKELIVNYNSISFLTYPDEGSYDVLVKINDQDPLYENQIKYTFATQYSPEIQNIEPLKVNSTTEIVIKGRNFDEHVSNINVEIGNEKCNVFNASFNEIRCLLNGLNLGQQDIYLNILNKGDALKTQFKIEGLPSLESINPNSGSLMGGTLIEIIGNGFENVTTINFGNSLCLIKNYTIHKIYCTTTKNSQSTQLVNITTNGILYYQKELYFEYTSDLTPIVTQTIYKDNILNFKGYNFSNTATDVNIKIGNQSCLLLNISTTEIICHFETQSAGIYDIMAQINPFGFAKIEDKLEFSLNITQLSYNSAGVAGGLNLNIQGTGFSNNTKVLICDKECKRVNGSVLEINCIVPASNNLNTSSDCVLQIFENQLTISTNFSYIKSITPIVTNLNRLRGGTGGGSLLIITGENFNNDTSKVKVTIANTTCKMQSSNETHIECKTGAYRYSSIKALIQVYIEGVGIALNDNVYFEYIDLWSSKFTWGGQEPPVEGDLVVISKSQTVFFDTQTPVLKGVLIIGGSLIFDDEQDVHLQAEYMIIADGGKLQIGTEEKPFLHKAQITMYGTARSIELPIFGSKVIALRNGTIDIHGKPVGVTWTQLGQTALAGSSQITLKESVIWENGSEIVIATTGDKFSVKESELRTIIGISDDKKTLYLDKPLNYTHLSITRQVGSGSNTYQLEIRAEVGLLTRNILIRGKNDDSWNSLKSAKSCPQGFNPSEFAVQTCFLGRYGDEIGSDEFGATIMIHADMSVPRTNKEYVIIRIQNAEFYHVGQSFRLGRYPIHFHLNGDMPSSYVKECAIHKSFNRAINIHGTNYVSIERNFIYDIMGGAYFLEDGVEIGNTFKYNLAIFVKTSSSLLTEDSTPAAYWVTNPNNTLLHNVVAGGTHFGFWYRLLDNPDGPSFDPNYCPKKIPLGKFYNNSVHSSGRIGLWFFPGYTPSKSGGCRDPIPSVAKFEQFTSYSNEKGAEWVFSNNLQFRNFIIFDQFGVGIETKNVVFNKNFNYKIKSLISTFYNEDTGPAILDSLIVGNSDPSTIKSVTDSGLVLAWDRGQLIKNVTFINFMNENTHAMRGPQIIGTCVEGCGGWINKLSNIKFENVRYKTLHRWDWDLIYHDLDGSLTGQVNGVVVFNNNLTQAEMDCVPNEYYFNGTVCRNKTKWIRFAYNNLKPELSLRTNYTNYNNKMAVIPKLAKRLTHPKGYMAALEANQEYLFIFDEALYPTNVSYDSGFYNVEKNDYIIIKHQLFKKPDRVYFDNSLNQEVFYPLNTSNNLGDWYWNYTDSTLSYLIINKNTAPFQDFEVLFKAFKCRYIDCIPPVQPALRPPVKSRPADALFWSNVSTWTFAEPGWGGYESGNYVLPGDGQSVKIPEGKYVVVDCPLPIIKNLYVEGVLELDNNMDHRLEADLIFINGGQLIIGWENDPILKNVEIVLNGKKDDLNFRLPDGVNLIGGKGIGVYGGLDLHGRPRNLIWTQLQTSSLSGSNKIILKEAVDWEIGELIVIGPTSYASYETEVVTIVEKLSDNKTIIFNTTLLYDHMGFNESYSSSDNYQIGAGVGLLSRNIKIIGAEYDQQYSDLYGFRIIVSDYSAYSFEGDLLFYKGYARISNVEFVHPGQYSRNSEDDFKYGILFSNLGDYDYIRPTYVRNCAFHHGYSAAIGLLESNSIPIENNVIHHTIDFAIQLEGHSNQIRKNFIVLVYWSASILTWDADFNTDYWGAINAYNSKSMVLENNLISGAERLGLLYKGDLCENETLDSSYNHSIKDNTIYSTLSGVVILPTYFYENLNCIKISGFTVFKSMHWGIYYQGPQSIRIESNKLIDNYVSIFTMVIQPPPIQHEISNKYALIKNSLIVGQSSNFNCKKDERTYDLNYLSAKKIVAFGSGPQEKGKIGIVWSNFIGSTNMAPVKPWTNIMTYNTIDGSFYIENVTFTNFNQVCGYRNYILSSSKNNDDGQHPVIMKNIKLFNVEEKSKVWIHRPNINKINIWDCIDMDCDGLKKNLLNDVDGSFLGETDASVISQSEFEWGSQQRGLGDFRIPKEALAAPNGSMIDPKLVYKYPGIVRNQTDCTYISDWQAYKCLGMGHKMLIIESMDPDTLTRRISPVAILSDTKYLDLINGPQDHGCCFGYTCLKRISTFMTIVAKNRNFDIYFTGTPPKQTRFRVLNANHDFKIRLSLHYFTPNRVDVYKNDSFMDPTNALYKNGKLTLKDPSSNVEMYMPKYYNESGTNFAFKNESKVYFTIHGSDYIDLKVTPVVNLKFEIEPVNEESFYDPDKLVENMANLLNVPKDKIRFVKIVEETNSNRRRSVNSQFIVVTIFENPIDNLNKANESNKIDSLINNLSSNIINQYASGQLQEKAQVLLKINLIGMSVPNSNGTEVKITRITKIIELKEADKCKEHSPCEKQPIILALNENNEPLKNLANDENPWLIEASLFNSSNPLAKAIYQTQAKLDDEGYFRFNSLGISDLSDSFRIKYELKTPSSINQTNFQRIEIISNKTLSSTKAIFTCNSKQENLIIDENKKFSLSVSLIDQFSSFEIKNLSWNNNGWNGSVEMYQLDKCQSDGELKTDSLNLKIDISNGLFYFNNLYITKSGMYLIKINISATNGDYQSSCISKSILVKKSSKNIIINDDFPPAVYLKFKGNFSQKMSKSDYFKAMIYNCFIDKYDLLLSRTISVYEGSILVNTDLSGTSENVAGFVKDLKNGFSLDNQVVLSDFEIFGSTYFVDSESTTTTTTIASKTTTKAQSRNLCFQYKLKEKKNYDRNKRFYLP